MVYMLVQSVNETTTEIHRLDRILEREMTIRGQPTMATSLFHMCHLLTYTLLALPANLSNVISPGHVIMLVWVRCQTILRFWMILWEFVEVVRTPCSMTSCNFMLHSEIASMIVLRIPHRSCKHVATPHTLIISCFNLSGCETFYISEIMAMWNHPRMLHVLVQLFLNSACTVLVQLKKDMNR